MAGETIGSALMGKADLAFARMEQLGAETVREIISSGRWPANYYALAQEWLRDKDDEDRELNKAQLFLEEAQRPPLKAVH